MLSAEDNELLTRTGPGTAMGALLRHYWIPVCSRRSWLPAAGSSGSRCSASGSSRIVPPKAGPGWWPRSARIAAPRSTSGGTRRAACAARITAGSSGWTGSAWTCRASRRSRASRPRYALAAYPCAEAGGVVWAYMGPAEPAAALARARVDARCRSRHLFISKRVQECNWFQALEGGIDSSHISFLHAPIRHNDSEVTLDMDRASFGVGAAVETGRQGAALRGGGHRLRRPHRRRAPPARRAGVLAHLAVSAALPHHAARGCRTTTSCSRISGCPWTTPMSSTGW